jgi:copper ion binding protein
MTSSTTTSYLVRGMTCEHCVRAVSAEVGAVSGVRDVQVDLERKTVTVTSDVEPDDAAIRAAVEDAGYEVAP